MVTTVYDPFDPDVLDEKGLREAEQAVADGLLRCDRWQDGRAVLTDRGRLLADGVVTRLLG